VQYKSEINLIKVNKCKWVTEPRVLIYSPDGSNVYAARGGEFEGKWFWRG